MTTQSWWANRLKASVGLKMAAQYLQSVCAVFLKSCSWFARVFSLVAHLLDNEFDWFDRKRHWSVSVFSHCCWNDLTMFIVLCCLCRRNRLQQCETHTHPHWNLKDAPQLLCSWPPLRVGTNNLCGHRFLRWGLGIFKCWLRGTFPCDEGTGWIFKGSEIN